MTRATQMSIDHGTVHAAVAHLHATGDDLDRRRVALHRRFADFLDGEWRGPASTSFVEGWELWAAGAADLVTALHELADLVLAHDLDVHEQDAAARSAAALLAARLAQVPAS